MSAITIWQKAAIRIRSLVMVFLRVQRGVQWVDANEITVTGGISRMLCP